jgi:hypothetical protein
MQTFLLTITLTQLQKELLQEIVEKELMSIQSSNPWPGGGKSQVIMSLKFLLAKLK